MLAAGLALSATPHPLVMAATLDRVAPSGSADPRATYRSLEAAPPAVEGGVLLIPFTVDGPAASPPREVGIELDDGRVVRGVVGWISPSSLLPGPAPLWTESPEPFTVSTVPADPPLQPPLLLAELPEGYRGSIALIDPQGRRSAALRPRWIEAATPRPLRATDPPALGEWAMPDPRHPLEHFRAVLLADRYGAPPPPPPGDEAGRLAAQHQAELWRAALHRVEQTSRGVAAEIRERLTATCSAPGRSGEGREVAAWLADPVAQRSLLALILDDERTGREVMQAALAWIRARPEPTIWISSSLGDSVSFEVANPGVERIVMRCRWLEGDPIPSAAVVPPRSVQRFTLRRPPLNDARMRSELEGVLVVEFPGGSGRLDFGPAPQSIRPPALPLGPLRPPLSLAAAQRGIEAPPPAPDRQGFAELRRRGGRWELFVECFRPDPGWRDELELRLGASESPVAVLRIPEHGPIDSGEAVVHRRSHSDRWRCRIELPDAWLAEALVGLEIPAVGFALLRTLEPPEGGPPQRMSLGPPPPPWRGEPATIAVDLSTWPAGPE